MNGLTCSTIERAQSQNSGNTRRWFPDVLQMTRYELSLSKIRSTCPLLRTLPPVDFHRW
jgi:hypothetical protein